MTLTILDSINSPGKGSGTGDDRYGFDEGAGTAWVLDGATDLTDLRLFKGTESDAAWIAEALSRDLAMNPRKDHETLEAYFASVLSLLRADAVKASKLPIDTVPPESWPIASGIWMQARSGKVEFAWLGDCMALVETPTGKVEVIGSDGKSDRETEVNREMAELSREDKLARLRKIRHVQNTDPQHMIFGLNPAAIDNLQTAERALPTGTRVTLMSDGLWRLVDPYNAMSPAALASHIHEHGLPATLSALRDVEARPDRDLTTRFKSADDACAVMVRV